MKRVSVVFLALLVAAGAGFVGCAGTPGAAAVPPAPVPEIVITGTHSAESGEMQFQGFAVSTTAPIEYGTFTVVVAAGSTVQIPGWDASGGGPFPFLGNSVDTGTGTYTVTGITVGGIDIRELLGVADWAGVLASPNFPARDATLTATDYGIEVTDRGTGPHDNNNGLRVNVAALARLYADR